MTGSTPKTSLFGLHWIPVRKPKPKRWTAGKALVSDLGKDEDEQDHDRYRGEPRKDPQDVETPGGTPVARGRRVEPGSDDCFVSHGFFAGGVT